MLMNLLRRNVHSPAKRSFFGAVAARRAAHGHRTLLDQLEPRQLLSGTLGTEVLAVTFTGTYGTITASDVDGTGISQANMNALVASWNANIAETQWSATWLGTPYEGSWCDPLDPNSGVVGDTVGGEFWQWGDPPAPGFTGTNPFQGVLSATKATTEGAWRIMLPGQGDFGDMSVWSGSGAAVGPVGTLSGFSSTAVTSNFYHDMVGPDGMFSPEIHAPLTMTLTVEAPSLSSMTVTDQAPNNNNVPIVTTGGSGEYGALTLQSNGSGGFHIDAPSTPTAAQSMIAYTVTDQTTSTPLGAGNVPTEGFDFSLTNITSGDEIEVQSWVDRNGNGLVDTFEADSVKRIVLLAVTTGDVEFTSTADPINVTHGGAPKDVTVSMSKAGHSWSGGVTGVISNAAGGEILVAGLSITKTGGGSSASGNFSITATSAVAPGTYHVRFRDAKDPANFTVIDLVVN